MNDARGTQRATKYMKALQDALAVRGHATNAELLEALRVMFPDVSATTIHRATARLAARGDIAPAPAAADGAMRYDVNVQPHDHFLCTGCGMLRDTDVKEKVVPLLESSIGDCHISGRLTISGICKLCKGGASA
jgi:Fe2+ or Zn2+ uptake regulation protein